MSTLFVICALCFFSGTSGSGQNELGEEVIFQEALRWNYTYMNPTCTSLDGRNPCMDIRICTFAVASLAMGGWPTLCGWVGKGVPKVCCGLPLVLGPRLMKKASEELARKRECGTTIYSPETEITKRLFQIKEALPEVDTSDPSKFDPPLDLAITPILIPPAVSKRSRQGLFPWMVSIRQNGSHLCGGSLIDRKHILTAASCVLDDKNQYSVHVGNLYVDDGHVFLISKISIHPQYEAKKNSRNLAVITLSEEILTPNIAHICLLGSDSVGVNMEGMTTTLLQWSEKIQNGEKKQYLNVIDDLTIVPTEKCRRKYEMCTEETISGLNDDLICIESVDENTVQFKANVGGPLMYRNNYVNDPRIPWTAIAVDTFGFPCESAPFLRLLIRLSRYMDWIEEIMNE